MAPKDQGLGKFKMYKGPKRKFNRRLNKTRRMSEYGLQFVEKQKLKMLYGLREKDLKNYFLKARKVSKPTEEVLASLLEARLDNAVYRLGWAKTRIQARQIVNHGHILVNEKKVNIPSYQVKKGDKIEIKNKSQASPLFSGLKEALKQHTPPLWLKRDKDIFKAEVLSGPEAKDFTEPIDIKLIVEFYRR